jgi:carboxymethylenebutenolidase
MNERVVSVTTKDGRMNTYVFHPDRAGPFPVVVLYMDSIGVREELCDMCRRIATVGYYVVMPNLYYRRLDSVDIDPTRMLDPAYGEKAALLWDLMASLGNAMGVEDTRSLLDFIDADPQARNGPLAAVGYCMSGPFVLSVAAEYPDRVAAAASVYGVHLITDEADSPHLRAGRIKGEIYVACAEHDKYVPAAEVQALRELLQAAKVNATVEVYPQCEHGFAFPARRMYKKAAAERHWEALFDLFQRNL